MLKNICQLETVVQFKDNLGTDIVKNGRLLLDNDTPIHAVKEMLFSFLKYVGQIEDNIKSQQDAANMAQVTENPVESVSENIIPLQQEQLQEQV